MRSKVKWARNLIGQSIRDRQQNSDNYSQDEKTKNELERGQGDKREQDWMDWPRRTRYRILGLCAAVALSFPVLFTTLYCR